MVELGLYQREADKASVFRAEGGKGAQLVCVYHKQGGKVYRTVAFTFRWKISDNLADTLNGLSANGDGLVPTRVRCVCVETDKGPTMYCVQAGGSSIRESDVIEAIKNYKSKD